MTTWFVSRHPGALQWMHRHGPSLDRHVTHLAAADVQPGDRVYGTLPCPWLAKSASEAPRISICPSRYPKLRAAVNSASINSKCSARTCKRFDVRRM